MESLLNQFLSGLSHALVLFMVASGLSLIFGVLQVLNFAQGSFYMLGAYICFWLFERLKVFEMTGFFLSIILTAVLLGLIGLIFEVALLRRTYRYGHMPQLLLTFAFTLIIFDLLKIICGGNFYNIPVPAMISGILEMGGAHLPVYNFIIIVIGFLIYGLLWLLIYRTRTGRILRAAVFDREVVSILGIPTSRLFCWVFVLGIFLTGLAAGIYVPASIIALDMDTGVVIDSFAVVIIGGVGSLTGTLLGALLVGMVQAFGLMIFPEMSTVLTFILLAVVLLIKPEGLFSQSVR